MKSPCDLLIHNIGQLLTVSGASDTPKIIPGMNDVSIINDGAVAIKNGIIIGVGTTEKLKKKYTRKDFKCIDASGKVVLPGFVDCHTHTVFGGDRSEELVQRIEGRPYQEILKQGGGILSTVNKTREMTVKHLTKTAKKHLDSMLLHGTTTVEIKSGYGLDLKNELKILKAIQSLRKIHHTDIVSTFLGAHVIPPEFKKKPNAYVDLVCEMLPEVKPYVKYCDVFCDEGAFDAVQSEKILRCAKELGLQLKIHTNQFKEIGGISLGIKSGCVSMDHLDIINRRSLKQLKKFRAVCVLLPGVPFFLMHDTYAPAKQMIEHGNAIALATDFNPGTCPCTNIQMMISLACLKMGMTPAQAINASTINAAHALGLAHQIGSIEVGKQGDVIILDILDYNQLPCFFGVNHVQTVIKKGFVVVDKAQMT